MIPGYSYLLMTPGYSYLLITALMGINLRHMPVGTPMAATLVLRFRNLIPVNALSNRPSIMIPAARRAWCGPVPCDRSNVMNEGDCHEP
jgi:hypothetical protein